MKSSRSKYVRFIALFAVLALALSACGSDSDSGDGGSNNSGNAETKQGGDIVIAAEQELTNFNQNTSADNLLWGAMVVRLIWPQMYFQTPDLKLEPGFMADGRAEVLKKDPFTLQWKINKDANWADGTPVSSDDLEYYWESCNGKIDPGEPVTPPAEAGDEETTGVDCVSTDGYDQVTKFTKVDEKTVQAEFKGPIAEYESLFSNPMPPAHIAKEFGKDGWAKAFVSSPGTSAGPYQLKSYKKGDSITLEKNPEFWGTPANLDTITFRFIPKPADMITALGNGEVDLIYPQPQTDLVQQVADLPGVEDVTSIGVQWEHLTYNLRNKALADPKVRQAVNLGVNRQEIVDKLLKTFTEDATVLNNRIYMNDQAEYEDNAGNFANQDVEKANSLLDEAGWVKGSDGIRAKGGEKLSFIIMTTPDNTLREDTQELVQSQLKEIGVDIKISNPPDPFTVIFGQEETAADWDIALFAWVGTVTPAISSAPVYGEGQGNNPGAYANPEVDAKFQEAIAELDKTRFAELLNEADTMMWADDQMPDLPLYQKPSFIAYSDKFVNIVDNTTSEGFTWNAEKWSLK